MRLLGDFLSSYRQHKPGIFRAGFAGFQEVFSGKNAKALHADFKAR
ncbi:hypothetical protein EC970259_0141 [Escherichia coli 99.0741]|nr:hypothetical protein EC970259_0141 [Escherichia coli 99.0741]